MTYYQNFQMKYQKPGIIYNNKITSYENTYTLTNITDLNVSGDSINNYNTINTFGNFHADNLSNISKIKVNNNTTVLKADCTSIDSKNFTINGKLFTEILDMKSNNTTDNYNTTLSIDTIDNYNTTLSIDTIEITKIETYRANIMSGSLNIKNYKDTDNATYTSKNIDITQFKNSFTSTINVDTVTLKAGINYSLTDNIKETGESSEAFDSNTLKFSDTSYAYIDKSNGYYVLKHKNFSNENATNCKIPFTRSVDHSDVPVFFIEDSIIEGIKFEYSYADNCYYVYCNQFIEEGD